jgi:hypothetical protein
VAHGLFCEDLGPDDRVDLAGDVDIRRAREIKFVGLDHEARVRTGDKLTLFRFGVSHYITKRRFTDITLISEHPNLP